MIYNGAHVYKLLSYYYKNGTMLAIVRAGCVFDQFNYIGASWGIGVATTEQIRNLPRIKLADIRSAPRKWLSRIGNGKSVLVGGRMRGGYRRCVYLLFLRRDFVLPAEEDCSNE
jgi:hypothetical protein